MSFRRGLGLFLILFSVYARATANEFSIEGGDFRLIDSQSHAQYLSYFSDQKAIVLLAWPGECGNREEILKWFADLEKKVGRKTPITFLWLNSSLPQDRAFVNQRVKGRFKSSVLMDFSQTVSKSFQFKTAGDYVVIDPQPWHLRVSGNWQDGKLEEELEKISGLKVFKKSTSMVNAIPSCPLKYEDFSSTTWNPALSRIFFRNCVACHMRTEFTDIFKNDLDVFNWATMNRTVTRLYRMPPQGGDNDPSNSNCVSGLAGYRLNQKDQRLVQNWLELGSPHASGPDLTAGLRKEFEEKGKKDLADFKTPDLIWKMQEPYTMHAQGTEFYQSIKVAGPLPEDLDILGYEISLNRNIVDHFSLAAFPTEQKSFVVPTTHNIHASQNYNKTVLPFTVGPTRGSSGLEYESRYQLHMNKGSYVYFLITYHPSGRVEENQATIQVFLNKTKKEIPFVRHLVFPVGTAYLPVGTRKYVQKLTHKFKSDAYITRMSLHGHLSTTAVEVHLKEPGKKEQVICRVPYYNRGFQEMIEPVLAPKNSEMSVFYTYDVSNQNPAAMEAEPQNIKGVLTFEAALTTRIFYTDQKKIVDDCWDSDLGCVRVRPFREEEK